MYHNLHTFLATIWSHQDQLLYGPPNESERAALEKSEYPPTLEDRIYLYYSSEGEDGSPPLEKKEYTAKLASLDGLARACDFKIDNSQAGSFKRYQSNHAAHGDYRVFLNPRLDQAAEVVKKILALAEVSVRHPRVQPRGSVLSFQDTVAMVKIAEAKEAFSGRADKIVVYVNNGAAAAEKLARKLLEACPGAFQSAVPSMTRKIANGIALAQEISGDLWSIGTSFGQVRCNLIAHALVETVLGKSYDDLKGSQYVVTDTSSNFPEPLFVALRVPLTRSPHSAGGWKKNMANHWEKTPGTAANFAEFNEKVAARFREAKLDATAPWQ